MSANEGARSVDERRVISRAGHELRESLVEKVIADVRAARMNAWVFGGVLDALPGKIKSALGHLGLSPIGVAGDNGDAHPILLAALEVHPLVGPTGILPKYGVESDERLNDVNPFGVTNASKALEARSEEHTSELQSPCNLVCR